MSTSNPLNQFIILNDGRKFGFAEWGDLKGNPVLLFVGGSSRIVRPPIDLPGLRLITVDRPGIGLSDFHSKRTLLNLPDDILQLIDYLDIKQLAVVGMSQGGPSALACAYKIPNRLVSAAAVSSLAPLPASQLQKLGPVASFSWLANNFPFALKIQSTLGAWMVALSPSWTFQQVLKSLPPSDRSIFETDQKLVEMFIKDLGETYRQGSRGSAQEGLLAYRPWGFELAEIGAKIHVWHGEKDQSAPIAMGHYLADSIPKSESIFLADEGHFLGLKYWWEIVEQLYN